MTRWGRAIMVGVTVAIAGWGATPAQAQQLDEFDYENLQFRGIGLEVGYILPTRVDATPVFGGRIDLGYLGPGFRVVPTISYWSSSFERAEVAELETQLETLIGRETGKPGRCGSRNDHLAGPLPRRRRAIRVVRAQHRCLDLCRYRDDGPLAQRRRRGHS